MRFSFTNCSHDIIKEEFNISDNIQTKSGQFTVETDSYSVSEGPGSLLKYGGTPIDPPIFGDRQLETGNPSSSSSFKPLIFSSLRDHTVTLETHTYTL